MPGPGTAQLPLAPRWMQLERRHVTGPKTASGRASRAARRLIGDLLIRSMAVPMP